MHILLVHQVFLSANDSGGTRHYEFARHCIDAGHRFSVVASDVNYLTGKPIDAPQDQAVDAIRIVRAHMPAAIHRSFWHRVVAFITFMFSSARAALRIKGVDLVMGTSPPLFQAVSAWFVSAIKRKPLLLEIRDLWPDFAIDMGVLKNPVLIWVARRLERFLYHRAAHILVNSPAYRDYLLDRHSMADTKITVIPNGVDPTMFNPAETGQAVRQEFGLEGKFLVVYAGAIGPANDIATLVRAAERLQDAPDVHLLLFGDGKDRARVEQLAAKRKLTNITFGGLRPKSQMKQVLGAADVCVATLLSIPMFTTTYPNKIFDYMAAGRPIVCGIDGVIRKVVEDADAGVFAQPGDDEAIAGAIRRLRADPEKAAAMGRRGRDYVSEHFNRAEHALQFRELAERVAGARRN